MFSPQPFPCPLTTDYGRAAVALYMSVYPLTAVWARGSVFYHAAMAALFITLIRSRFSLVQSFQPIALLELPSTLRYEPVFYNRPGTHIEHASNTTVRVNWLPHSIVLFLLMYSYFMSIKFVTLTLNVWWLVQRQPLLVSEESAWHFENCY